MQHLTEEQLVAQYYRDFDAPAGAAEHLLACTDCRTQYDTLCRVLSAVEQLPVPERADDYGDQVWNRLRWRLERRKRRTWQSVAALAAVLAIAFFAGQLWHARSGAASSPNVAATNVAQNGHGAVAASNGEPVKTTTQAASNDPQATQRVLVVVVGDHLDSTERVLLEIANADPKKQLDFAADRDRAAELVASNRIYRQTAMQRGETRIASVLSDIEPVLLEMSHAGATLGPDELASLQRRIDAKGLLFKVRVVSAQVGGGAQPPVASNVNQL